jgi:CRISPR/Cas system-associated exonuclease Cas4 (RecB family)
MLASLLRDRDEPAERGYAPHLSHSRVSRFLTCPEQYRLYYIEGLRPKVPPAALAFGQIVHQSLAELLQKKSDPVKCFSDSWAMVKGIPLGFNQRESWEKLKASGEGLLAKFASEELPKLDGIAAVERSFSLKITSLDLPFVGVIDLVAKLDGKRTVADWKTAGSAPDGHEAAMSDQLTAYMLAEPEAEQLALCVLVKTKEPQIEWHRVTRTADQLSEYLAKVGYVAREIAAGRFYKRPGFWCAWCDYLPVCVGDKRKAAETLVTVA